MNSKMNIKFNNIVTVVCYIILINASELGYWMDTYYVE